MFASPNFRNRVLIPGLLTLLLVTGSAGAREPVLRILVAGVETGAIDLAGIERQLPAATIEFFNPFYGKNKRYRAVPVRTLLDLVFGERWRSADFSDIAFRALDGYEAVARIDLLGEPGGYLAYRDLDLDTGWEPVGSNRADPGPFFLVWTGPEQTTAHAYPWPWQVAAVNLLRFEDQYPRVVPAGVEPGSPVDRGFRIFRARCIRCHAMDQQGGKIGPDLNTPQSITAYRSETMIKQFIHQPSRFRHTRMPDHTDLSEGDLDDLYRYLLHQAPRS